jgi:excinuclease ABC subunit A
MGPEGGAGGGTLVGQGTPEDIAANPQSYTGAFLAELLDPPAPKSPSRRKKVSA